MTRAADGLEVLDSPIPRSVRVAEAPGRGGTVRARGGWSDAVVHCRTCLSATRVSLLRLAAALVPSLWLPTRPWPRLMRCPACGRVSWCRIDWPPR